MASVGVHRRTFFGQVSPESVTREGRKEGDNGMSRPSLTPVFLLGVFPGIGAARERSSITRRVEGQAGVLCRGAADVPALVLSYLVLPKERLILFQKVPRGGLRRSRAFSAAGCLPVTVTPERSPFAVRPG